MFQKISTVLLVTVFAFSTFSCRSSKKILETSDVDMNDVVLVQHVDIKPMFDGKNYEQSFREYLSKNIRYPIETLQKGISDRVVVQFIIEKDGSVRYAKVIQSVHKSIDAEALRLIKNSPSWTPGIKDGEAVRVILNCPITFRNLGIINR